MKVSPVKSKISKRVLFSILFPVIVVLFIGLSFTSGIFSIFENKLIDFRFVYFNQNNESSKDIVFIDINEESLAQMSSEIGGWPWPRGGIIAQKIVDYVMLGNPAAFFFDVLYPEYSPKSPNEDVPGDDLILAETAGYYPNLSHAVLFDKGDDESMEVESSPEIFKENFEIVLNENNKFIKEEEFKHIIKPFDPLYYSSHLLHSVNHTEASDGVSRKSKLFIKHDDKIYPSLALRAIMLKIKAKGFETVKNNFVINDSDYGKISIPIDKQGDMAINFYKNLDGLETISAASIIKSFYQMMNGEQDVLVPLEDFDGKVVIIGSTATALHDIKVTPMGRMGGPYLHICAISNILQKQFLSVPPKTITFLIIFLSILIIILTTIYTKNTYFINKSIFQKISHFTKHFIFICKFISKSKFTCYSVYTILFCCSF